MKTIRWMTAAIALGLWPGLSLAADIDGRSLAGWWALPFAGILLSIAVLPLFAPVFWHHHFGKITAAWTLLFFIPFAALFGLPLAGTSLVHALLAEYIPFIVLLTALYTIAGGIFIRGNLLASKVPMPNKPTLSAGLPCRLPRMKMPPAMV